MTHLPDKKVLGQLVNGQSVTLNKALSAVPIKQDGNSYANKYPVR